MSSSLKRNADIQLEKEKLDEVESSDPGLWQSDPDQVSKRRRVKAIRSGKLLEGNNEAPTFNNPFSGISLTAPPPSVAPLAEPEELSAEKCCMKDPSVNSGPAKVLGLESYSTSNPFAALSGSHFGKAREGGLPTFLESTPLSGFNSIGSGIFPSIATLSSSCKLENRGHVETAAGEDIATTEVFSVNTAESTPLPLPETSKINGEEDVQITLISDCTLFEYDTSEQKWRERGKGEFKLTVDKAGQARMLMHQSGNLRLLLNAKVFASMSVQIMQNGNGVYFGCSNHASTPDTVSTDPKVAANRENKALTVGMSTWCLRFRSKEKVSELAGLLDEYKQLSCATQAGELIKELDP
ncbi:hypothetical protein CEUSTIGMA_g9573.t1 [Chlamydomonas eustigma]|uniref:RanBD1 domain-containing protein n=1 Tax=Chlamydomonas eustigma TaxID=1157962 RepID=A0A250XGE1_9CHLO|nr:hypothetical protein CEUSTIGMA_g9573.t1 [Chlamydomonas eustigma]|eukprot:GAX82145.1 hypothetical protein CEUSTIGMA_g9573.t1 [Chlamydomonas eustigma]